jgi:hypothetical protein
MLMWQWVEVTGNTSFDLAFNVVSIFALAGWSIGLMISMIRRLFR